MYIKNTTSEKQAARRSKGHAVGSHNINYKGYETKYLVVLEHTHYDSKYRRHHWDAKCKSCGSTFNLSSDRVKHAKSCGCQLNKPKNLTLNQESMHIGNLPNLLKFKWNKSLKLK